MTPVIRTEEKYFKVPIHVTFGVSIREDWFKKALKEDEELFKTLGENLSKLKDRKFDRDIFDAIIKKKKEQHETTPAVQELPLTEEDILLICGTKEKPNSLIDEFQSVKYIPTAETGDKVVVSLFKHNGDAVIEVCGPWHRVTWLETTVMQCVYETGLRYKLKNQKKSYAKWLSEALIRCRKTISQIGTITRFSDNKIKGALFTGRRTGGYAFLLLQNLLVSQEYGDCIGTSSVDAWYDLTKMKANFKLNPVGTHAHELSMVTSALFPELDENSLNLPLTQLLGHYLYYKQSNNSQPIPMLPDTLGTAAFMKAGNIIQVNGKRFLEIILNARQDSGKLEDFVKVMAKYDFWNPVMASEIDEPATLEKAWNMTYKDALGENCPEKEESNFPYKTFGAGGFFGDSEKAYNKTKDSISMAVKAIRVYKDYKASRVFPVKLGDGTGKLSINVTLNEDSLKKAENRAQKIKNEGVKNLGKNKASQIAEIQKLWDETTNEILQAQKGGRRSKSRSRKH